MQSKDIIIRNAGRRGYILDDQLLPRSVQKSYVARTNQNGNVHKSTHRY
jgi:hypothetical protein